MDRPNELARFRHHRRLGRHRRIAKRIAEFEQYRRQRMRPRAQGIAFKRREVGGRCADVLRAGERPGRIYTSEPIARKIVPCADANCGIGLPPGLAGGWGRAARSAEFGQIEARFKSIDTAPKPAATSVSQGG